MFDNAIARILGLEYPLHVDIFSPIPNGYLAVQEDYTG